MIGNSRHFIRWVLSGVTLVLAPVSAIAGPLPLDGPQPRGPGVLVEHLPHNYGGYASDTLLSEIPGGQPTWQLLADNFALSATDTVRRIQFWGLYNYGIEPTTTETFEVTFQHARPGDGLPGDVFYDATFADVPREWTGRLVIVDGAPREYMFTIELPNALLISAGEQDWLSIYQVGDLSSTFRWEQSATNPEDGTAIQNPNYANWISTFPFGDTANAAFRLSSVPEPAALWPLGLTTTALVAKRRGRGGRP